MGKVAGAGEEAELSHAIFLEGLQLSVRSTRTWDTYELSPKSEKSTYDGLEALYITRVAVFLLITSRE